MKKVLNSQGLVFGVLDPVHHKLECMQSRTEEARSLKFQIEEKGGMYYSEHKGADQLRSLYILSLGLKTITCHYASKPFSDQSS